MSANSIVDWPRTHGFPAAWMPPHLRPDQIFTPIYFNSSPSGIVVPSPAYLDWYEAQSKGLCCRSCHFFRRDCICARAPSFPQSNNAQMGSMNAPEVAPQPTYTVEDDPSERRRSCAKRPREGEDYTAPLANSRLSIQANLRSMEEGLPERIEKLRARLGAFVEEGHLKQQMLGQPEETRELYYGRMKAHGNAVLKMASATFMMDRGLSTPGFLTHFRGLAQTKANMARLASILGIGQTRRALYTLLGELDWFSCNAAATGESGNISRTYARADAAALRDEVVEMLYSIVARQVNMKKFKGG